MANHLICAEEGFVIALTAADLDNNFFTEVSWHNHISGDLIFRKRLEGWSATIIGLGGGYVSRVNIAKYCDKSNPNTTIIAVAVIVLIVLFF